MSLNTSNKFLDLIAALLSIKDKPLSIPERREIIGQETSYDLQILRELINFALETNKRDYIHAALELYWINPNHTFLEKEFNQLLINGNHYKHQKLLYHLQTRLKYESSVQYIERLLEKDFRTFFEYSGSEDYTIAQWCGHALQGIGTEEAHELIRQYSNSSNEGIRSQMQKRLKAITPNA